MNEPIQIKFKLPNLAIVPAKVFTNNHKDEFFSKIKPL
jgi:hypothetical protein